MHNGARIAVDIGGTFTDVVLEHGEVLHTAKVLTTQPAPDDAVVAGIIDVLASSKLEASQVQLVIHGTTLGTNAILERKGARTAFITTAGFRDVLEIGYESRYDQYDILIEKPVPLVPRSCRLSVRERIDITGRVLEPLVEADVEGLIPALQKLDIESVAIGFLHAYANPDHEQRVRDLVARSLPGLSISLSSEVCPEVREYERFSTTAANAYIRPMMERYLSNLGRRLVDLGLGCPLLMMTSGGGLTSLATAVRLPIRLVESGPAGGAILASQIAQELGLDKVISFDMGGTTAKICLVEKGAPKSAREFEVDRAARFIKGSGLPLRIPVIEMVEIGAGGGSIARLDAMRQIAVGPDSAGADPGPAGYGRGGTEPTITDADIVLGRIDPTRFAGGKVELSPSAAAAAITDRIGAPLALDTNLAAFGITEMVDETMANAARVHAVEKGAVASEHTLIAFGGAAPIHAARLAEKLLINRIVVPSYAGVGSAIGFLRAPVSYDVVRSRHMRLDRLDHESANQILADMKVEATAVVAAGAPGKEMTEARGAYMRYVGQGHEIYVSLPLRDLEPTDREALQDAFDAEYEKLYKRAIPNAEVEVLTWALALSADLNVVDSASPPDQPGYPEGLSTDVSGATGSRPVFDPERGENVDIALYWRSDLSSGARITGPAFIAENETSTFVAAGFDATITRNGHIVAERNGDKQP